jgi:hypothetical protein
METQAGHKERKRRMERWKWIKLQSDPFNTTLNPAEVRLDTGTSWSTAHAFLQQGRMVIRVKLAAMEIGKTNDPELNFWPLAPPQRGPERKRPYFTTFSVSPCNMIN